MAQYDIIVLGSGINSLVAASVIAKAGKKVLVLESRNTIGGLASTNEFAPGFMCNVIYDTIKWIDPRIIKELRIKSDDLDLIDLDIKRIALGAGENKQIIFHKDPLVTCESISDLSRNDSTKWKDFTIYVKKLTKFLEKLYQLTPPSLPDIGLLDVLSMRSLFGTIMKQGPQGLVDLARTAPMMMPELMDEWFENELLRSALSTAGIHGLSYGPYASATGYNFLHQHLYSKGVIHNSSIVKGGISHFPEILNKILSSFNADIRKNVKVKSINIKNNTFESVTTQEGETINSDQIISGLDPHNTFINLIGNANLDPSFHTQINNIKYRGSTARIHFALRDIPKIEGINNDHINTVFSICPSMEYLERASDAVKYGFISKDPYLEFSIPSTLNPEFSPVGKHVLSVSVQYAPYQLRNRIWDTDSKEQLKQNTIQVLEKKIPDLTQLIEAYLVYSPKDLEAEFGIKEGNLNHGEMTLDQLFFMRPTASSSQYSTPFKNLYLCGPGTHPGGGLHGTNGYNAAKTVLKS